MEERLTLFNLKNTENEMKTQEEKHTVYVNGIDVTKSFVSEDTALAIKFAFDKLGYEDVSIETTEET
jgi:hypothetical protein